MALDAGSRRAMRTRLVVGPALILLIVLVTWLDFGPGGGRGVVAAAVFGLLGLGGLWEYGTMMNGSGRPVATPWLLVAGAALFFAPFLPAMEWRRMDGELLPMLLVPGGLTLVLVLLGLLPKGMENALERMAFSLLGLVLFGLPLYLAQGLCRFDLALVIWLVVTAKGGDIGAYFVGSFLGRHKMIPHVSPGKSWEGAVGGLAVSMGVGGLLSLATASPELDLGFPLWALLGIMVGMCAQVSDLVESLLKRRCNVKDSSRLLPVHGGILDLTDSFVLSVPPLFLIVMLPGGAGV